MSIPVPCHVTIRAHRRPSAVESAAAHLGAALVRWAERRTAFPPGWVEQQRAAVRRRQDQDVLRGDILGVAHSGLFRGYR